MVPWITLGYRSIDASHSWRWFINAKYASSTVIARMAIVVLKSQTIPKVISQGHFLFRLGISHIVCQKTIFFSH